jgi:hypothetical protein
MLNKLLFASGTVLVAVFLTSPASALTMKECSTKYQAAKADGSAKDVKWNDFRSKFCGADTAATQESDDPTVSEAIDSEPAKPTAKAPKGVTFPAKLDSKYASEPAYKGRMHTCVDAYHVNKSANTLNGLKWIQKGGGYYSLCNARLKGKV